MGQNVQVTSNMSALKRAIREEGYCNPPKDLIPELMLLGEFTSAKVMLQTGDLVQMASISYKGKKYVMKAVPDGRWFDARH